MTKRVPNTIISIRHAMIVLFSGGLIIFGLVASANLRDDPTIDDVLSRTRNAVFGPTGQPDDRVLELQGPAKLFEMDMQGTFVFDRDGRFRGEFSIGEMAQITGYDGTHTWGHDPSGNVRTLQDGNEKSELLFYWFLSSYWLSPDNDMSLAVSPQDTTGDMVGIHIDAGHGVEGIVLIDRTTWLPQSLKTTQYGRDMIVNIGWGERLGDRALPKRLVMIDGGRTKIKWDITRIESLEEAPSYAKPGDTIRVVFDRAIEPKLRVMKASGGHLWVRPLINGRDMGWFLFDTGADATIIDERIARELDLPRIGELDSTGIGGRTKSVMHTVESLQLGGVRVENIPVYARNLTSKNRSMGTDVAGILGNDLLSQGIIVYDELDVAIEFHVPDMYELPDAQWQDMPVHNGKPAVHLEYEGHTGLFVIDTGAPGRLIIGPQAIDRYKLLEGRQTRSSAAFGSGGSVAARTGTVDYVLWGGERFENVPARFITQNQGSGADVQRDGIVGANLIRRFIVVFDIEGERIAYLDRR